MARNLFFGYFFFQKVLFPHLGVIAACEFMVKPKASGLGLLDVRGFWAFLEDRTPGLCEVCSPPLLPFLFLLTSVPLHEPPGSMPLQPTAPPHPAPSEPPPPTQEKNELQPGFPSTPPPPSSLLW